MALNVLDGTVIGRNMARHRHQEFIRVLNAINTRAPAGKAVLVILDNYAAHKHPRCAPGSTGTRASPSTSPTSASWLNAVKGFFAKLAKRRLKRGVFHSLVELQAAINRFLAEHNLQPKPFTWTADPDRIIAAVKRGHQALNSIGPDGVSARMGARAQDRDSAARRNRGGRAPSFARSRAPARRAAAVRTSVPPRPPSVPSSGTRQTGCCGG